MFRDDVLQEVIFDNIKYFKTIYESNQHGMKAIKIIIRPMLFLFIIILYYDLILCQYTFETIKIIIKCYCTMLFIFVMNV